jgi:type II secretion system protein H
MTLRTGKSKSDKWRVTGGAEPVRGKSTRNTQHATRMHYSAFTLVELILVMAILLVVLGVAFPSLKGFFRGRSLDSEARRFLSLTRYGQSRAVSEGVPMTLWINANQRAYGLKATEGYVESDLKAGEFTFGEELQIEAQMPAVTSQSRQWSAMSRTTSTMPTTRFLPDGSIAETSPAQVAIRQGESNSIWIVQSRNRLNYEIQKRQPPSVIR